MKTIKKSTLVCVFLGMLAFAAATNAGTINVFAQYIGSTSYSSPIPALQDAYNEFLSRSDMDFGVFYGPSSAGNFGFSHPDYTKNSGTQPGGVGGFHIFLYKTARWRLLKRYGMLTASNNRNSADACVVEDQTTGEQFIFLMPSGNTFPSVNTGSEIAPVTNMCSSCQSEYPNAKLIVGVSKAYGIFDGSKLGDSIVAWGCTQARSGTNGGAIYAQNHANHASCTDHSAASVNWLPGTAEPAAIATVTYCQQFTVAFKDWNGTSLGTAQTVFIGEDAIPPANPTRVGYTFTGWSGSYQNIQADTTLTAQYAINTYSVRFLDYDGTVLKSETVEYGSDMTPPANPTREGYHFIGWSGSYQNIQADTTLTAQYTINTYSVRFLDYDGTVLKSETVAHGSDAIPPADPTRVGYTFTGWSCAYANVTEGLTITAQYASDPSYTYTVTFQYTNGTVIAQQSVAYLGSATQPANPAPLDENTVFYRWEGTYTSVTNDVDVFAIFVNKVVEIGTGAEFAEHMGSDLVSLSNVTFAITNDISLSGVTYSKPNTFAATLDGRGHTLRNFPSHRDIKALCGTLTGTIRDLCIAGYNSPGNIGLTSLLGGSANGALVSGVVLSNCTWTVPGASEGTAGFFYTTTGDMTTMTNCTMVNCRVLGNNATRGAQVIGGFVGSANNLRMLDCHFIVANTNAVAVGGTIPIAGALIGQCGSGVTIERCSNNARVSVQSYVAAQDGSAGGLVGKSTLNSGSPTISACANFGAVESTVDSPAGGIIGNVGSEDGVFSFTLVDTFNYGSVSSPLAAGGLIGRYRGVTSLLRNNGNSGGVFSDTGFAGGLVGQISYNDDNRTWCIRNALQAGAVSTENGFAGIVVGGLESSVGSGLAMVVSNVVMAGSAVATNGGQAGLLIGGRDTNSQYDTAFTAEASSVLASNATLPHYYDKDNAPASLATAPAAIAPRALRNGMAKKQLDRAAQSNGWMQWIQGRFCPELVLFGTQGSIGLNVAIK